MSVGQCSRKTSGTASTGGCFEAPHYFDDAAAQQHMRLPMSTFVDDVGTMWSCGDARDEIACLCVMIYVATCEPSPPIHCPLTPWSAVAWA